MKRPLDMILPASVSLVSRTAGVSSMLHLSLAVLHCVDAGSIMSCGLFAH